MLRNYDLVGIREPVGINQMTEINTERCNLKKRGRRGGEKGLQATDRVGLAMKYRWMIKVAMLKLYGVKVKKYMK